MFNALMRSAHRLFFVLFAILLIGLATGPFVETAYARVNVKKETAAPELLKETLAAKSGSVMITHQMRANAVRNCARFAWARKYRDRLIAQVKPYMEMPDETLWKLLPAQAMPRDSGVNFNNSAGCPKCGNEHFKAPYNPSRWFVDFPNRPWQVQCRNCRQWFPANDFAAYYASALDKHYKFQLGKGDAQFLKPVGNAARTWVDDGTGVKIDGHKWFFAANYSFVSWTTLIDITKKLAILYTLTDDTAYAHKAGVLLDRMADLYPEMDYKPHHARGMEASTGGSGKGRVQGKIWECFTVDKLSQAYDYIFDGLADDKQLAEFAGNMSSQYHTGDKSSLEMINKHIRSNLINEFICGILDGRIHGNAGMRELAMTCAAIALDDARLTPRYLDWLFKPDGGNIPYVIVNLLGREGFSHETGLGYASIPGRSYYNVAELLQKNTAYTNHNLYRDFPKLRNCFTMCAKVRAADVYAPNWGDGNKCMNMGSTGMVNPLDMSLTGYRIYGGKDIAREVWLSNGISLDNIQLDIYADQPEAIIAKLKTDLAGEPEPLCSYNSGGYGCAFLQAPSRKYPRCIMMYYGRMIAHGHQDRLALQMIANNAVALPDMGYPLFMGAWPKRIGWTRHVISHNTCMVNDKGPQEDGSYSGKTQLFADLGFLRVADVDGQGGKIYDGVKTYRRCLVMVDTDEQNSYVLDLFWVRGGENHRLIQNAGGPEVTSSGLQLKPQAQGTYAGENVGFGEFYDGLKNRSYEGSGFMYLKRVAKARPDGDFWVDWKIVEPRRKMPPDYDAHLRLYNLAPVDEAALCDGIPPEYRGNPPSLRYMLRTRFGKNLNTQFVSVIEAYAGEPFIKFARAIKSYADDDNCSAAVEITLKDGRRDLVLVTEHGGSIEAGGVQMTGRVGLVRFDGQAVAAACLIEGASLTAQTVQLSLPQPAITGQLLSGDESDSQNTLLKLSTPLGTAPLQGKYIIFDNAERSDASYRIEKVVDDQTVSIGANSLAERFRDEKEYSRGVINNIAPGDRFRIALSKTYTAPSQPLP
ncbi:MAG: heparinase II/III family protein [Kiritimatiellae bacterium]|nr:heparinase II/III family protein [Kiritimatiellia bacterium]